MQTRNSVLLIELNLGLQAFHVIYVLLGFLKNKSESELWGVPERKKEKKSIGLTVRNILPLLAHRFK